MIELQHLIATARDLKSVEGENPEYDRALVELISNAVPGLQTDSGRAVVEYQIFKMEDA